MSGSDAVWRRLNEVLQSSANGNDAAAMEICSATPSLIDVSGAAISVRGRGLPPSTACASDATMERIEELQLLTGEGPCVTAAATRQPVLVPDLADLAENRWPGFASQAVTAGARAIFAFPLQVGSVCFGVMDLYRGSPGPLRQPDVADALVVADAATAALLWQQDLRPAGDLDEYWWDLDSFYRVEVHQATGMLIAQLGVDATEALLRLRAYAFQQDRSITDVARDIIARRLRFEPDP